MPEEPNTLDDYATMRHAVTALLRADRSMSYEGMADAVVDRIIRPSLDLLCEHRQLDQAEHAATVGRVRSALADIKTAIDTEMSDDESGLVRSYEILTAALDQGRSDLPAVREFAADFDPRGEDR